MSGIKLKSAKRDEARDMVLTYELSHSGPETVLNLDMTLTSDYRDGSFRAAIAMSPPASASPDEALDKLAEWMERSAAAIRSRGRGPLVPV